ncbi:MAG: hypothetical protein GX896_09315 [Clostridiales bacterium]|nr:hypothetical protein [Clostridiales bacterium]
MQGGIYNGKQIVSKNWLKEMTTPYISLDERFGNMSYGYLWWLIDEKANIYAAIGDGGNVIYVNEKSKNVVGITGTFKPRIFDRVQFIQEKIEPLL